MFINLLMIKLLNSSDDAVCAELLLILARIRPRSISQKSTKTMPYH